MKTRMLSLLAGAAVSLNAGAALAQSADQSAAFERELRADAATRTSLQAGGTAGHDGRAFFVGSADGNYRLEVGGYTQFRYTLNFRDLDDSEDSTDEDFTNGFEHTRSALTFGGNVINPNTAFFIRGYFENGDSESSGGSFVLRDAYGSYTWDSGLSVIWGQFIVPSTRERMVDERHQLAADRSVTGTYFSPEYAQGVALSYKSENFRVVGAIDDGANTQNTAYAVSTDNDVATTGRAEFKWSGDWAQFDDFTSWKGTEGYAGMVGAAFHWETSGDTGTATGGATTGNIGGDGDLIQYTADVSVEGNGWNAFGAFVGRSTDVDGGAERDDFGAIVQGGFFFNDNFEMFARWDAIFPDDDTDEDDFHTITVGGNYYFVAGSHAAKFTADVQWNLDQEFSGLTVDGSETSVLPTTEDEFAVRLQMQLVF